MYKYKYVSICKYSISSKYGIVGICK